MSSDSKWKPSYRDTGFDRPQQKTRNRYNDKLIAVNAIEEGKELEEEFLFDSELEDYI